MADAIREVSAETIEPRFRLLREVDVREKAPGEMVTVADEEAEAGLVRRLGALLPGAPVVGEESSDRDPRLLFALSAQHAWVVDPLDGTANFVAGSPHWAVMVALLRQGATVASWIWRPCDQSLYEAERGSGAQWNGQPLLAPSGPPGATGLRGAVLTRFLDPTARARLEGYRDRFAELTGGTMCAGVDYPRVAEGYQDFVAFRRTLPWDHAPGSLLVEEAGGAARRLDGSRYEPADVSTRGLLVARSADVWDRAVTWLR